MAALDVGALSAERFIGSEIALVGGGNSAGQAAVFLSGYAKHVHILIRGPELAATMSEYLVQRIAMSRHITLHTETEIVALGGEQHLTNVTWRNRTTGVETATDIENIFVMIGADPCTQWLGECVELDENGFVITGRDVESQRRGPYRTSLPGIFAVGDVRSGSVKRVASGVGEGSVVVADIHAYLKEKDLLDVPVTLPLVKVEETSSRSYGYSMSAVVSAQL